MGASHVGGRACRCMVAWQWRCAWLQAGPLTRKKEHSELASADISLGLRQDQESWKSLHPPARQQSLTFLDRVGGWASCTGKLLGELLGGMLCRCL